MTSEVSFRMFIGHLDILFYEVCLFGSFAHYLIDLSYLFFIYL